MPTLPLDSASAACVAPPLPAISHGSRAGRRKLKDFPRRLVKRAASAKTKANCAKASLKGTVAKKRRAAKKNDATKEKAATVAPVVNAATTKAASAKK